MKNDNTILWIIGIIILVILLSRLPLSPWFAIITPDLISNPSFEYEGIGKGTVLSFDGDDDYVDFGASPIPSSGDWTISGWVYYRGGHSQATAWGTGGVHCYRPNRHQHCVTKGVFLRRTTYRDYYDDLGFDIGDGESYSGGDVLRDISSVNANKWHFVTMTYNSSYPSLLAYVNGNRVSGAVENYAISGYEKFLVGKSQYDDWSHWKGYIDDLMIFNRSLSQLEISLLYLGIEPNGLIHNWKFDEGEGTAIYNSVGTKQGTIYGATWLENIPQSWYEIDEDETHILTFDNTVAHTGSKSVKLEVQNSDKKWFNWKYYTNYIANDNLIPIEPGNYVGKFWYKTENVASESLIGIGIHEFDENKNNIATNDLFLDNISGTNDWQEASMKWTPKAPTTKYISFALSFYGTDGIVWYDDVTFMKEVVVGGPGGGGGFGPDIGPEQLTQPKEPPPVVSESLLSRLMSLFSINSMDEEMIIGGFKFKKGHILIVFALIIAYVYFTKNKK